MENIRIAIVDDQNIFRQSLGMLINSIPGFELVTDAHSGQDFLEKLKGMRILPDIALIDMSMPGMNGIELNEMLQKQYPQIKIVVLSVLVQERLISKMIAAGADAYLEKNCNKDELITAINTVHTTGFYINQQTMEAIQHTANFKNKKNRELADITADITKREREVLEMICNELSAAEIAGKLCLSVRTVEGHRNNLLLKTGCRNTAGLVLFAVKAGIFSLGI
ncbi:response regulator transcription factor [Pedobacter sp. MR2016-19]|uniref:response regulator transcription factor n=1 Tax=Pedobacter sp. MR2016-19 TaxID=2780089 RepID=UPI001874C064|nr:response regulator transcription factor [Pedobacter sp. MR2016-19]MBE5318674.1 response regulator transcription factor [Pedobacter sp. MR2016-19]